MRPHLQPPLTDQFQQPQAALASSLDWVDVYSYLFVAQCDVSWHLLHSVFQLLFLLPNTTYTLVINGVCVKVSGQQHLANMHMHACVGWGVVV